MDGKTKMDEDKIRILVEITNKDILRKKYIYNRREYKEKVIISEEEEDKLLIEVLRNKESLSWRKLKKSCMNNF